MSDTQSITTDTRSEIALGGTDAPLERLLRRQRRLAWLLSIFTLTITVGFFGLMTLASPLLSRVVFGRSVTIANVAAVTIILLFLASIALFGRQATRIDEQFNDARSRR